jgi:hypothetical protein
MNPETKLVLDALSKRFDDLEARWERSFTEAGEKLEKEFAKAEEKWEIRFSQCDDKWSASSRISRSPKMRAWRSWSA